VYINGRIRKHGFFIILFSAMVVFLASCSLIKKTHKEAGPPLPSLEKIAVLPMDRANLKPQPGEAACALSDTFYEASDVSIEAARKVTKLLLDSLNSDPRFVPVKEAKCVSFLSRMLITEPNAPQLRLVQALGKELGVDAVLYGKLFRFEDRIGGPYGVERPASVTFTLYLIRTKDGAVLWRYAFSETQQPLTENLFKAGLYKKTGMRWLTAEELAKIGIEQALKDLKKRIR